MFGTSQYNYATQFPVGGQQQPQNSIIRRYSRDEGKANMISQLQSMMQDAPSSEEKEVLQSAMSKLRNM